LARADGCVAGCGRAGQGPLHANQGIVALRGQKGVTTAVASGMGRFVS